MNFGHLHLSFHRAALGTHVLQLSLEEPFPPGATPFSARLLVLLSTGNILYPHSPPSGSEREGHCFYLENLEEKESAQAATAVPQELHNKAGIWDGKLIWLNKGCVDVFYAQIYSLRCSRAGLIQRAEDGKRWKEWETAKVRHKRTCNAVGDLSSVVQEPKLLPSQRLASLLVSELVPGEKEKQLHEKQTLVSWRGIHCKKHYGIWFQTGTMQTQNGGNKSDLLIFQDQKSIKSYQPANHKNVIKCIYVYFKWLNFQLPGKAAERLCVRMKVEQRQEGSEGAGTVSCPSDPGLSITTGSKNKKTLGAPKLR